jgi:hypothetical protein
VNGGGGQQPIIVAGPGAHGPAVVVAGPGAQGPATNVGVGFPSATPSTQSILTSAAQQAHAIVGPGSGGTHGTHVHTAFQRIVDRLGNPSLATEQSYLNRQWVPRGTPGSVCLDGVEGAVIRPSAIYDLKTGAARLTPARIRQIRRHLPPGCENIPIIVIR